MHRMKPLPGYLVQRYRGWKATTFEENAAWYRNLAEAGQHPRTMVISCCDSRVHVTAIFGADQGEFFIHRNVANLVPPYTPDGDHHGTSAAVEYAVKTLKVGDLIVLGHTNCGGVKACHDRCVTGEKIESDFVGRWLEILEPRWPNVKDLPADERVKAFEHEAVLVSLENLLGYPFVAEAVDAGRLGVHGAITDIGEGHLSVYDYDKGFQQL
ncbi:carbonic anhydrase [Aestuariibius sp. 2305UL40-4]|uniref:carbonic anhydrase n=1 Tax=Aestuariibius violaceus TaxID=3234132 RepID=UPI00345E68BF